MSAEATVVRNYLDWMVELPWNVNKDKKLENVSMPEAKKILDDDHYGLEKIKERISFIERRCRFSIDLIQFMNSLSFARAYSSVLT